MTNQQIFEELQEIRKDIKNFYKLEGKIYGMTAVIVVVLNLGMDFLTKS